MRGHRQMFMQLETSSSHQHRTIPRLQSKALAHSAHHSQGSPHLKRASWTYLIYQCPSFGESKVPPNIPCKVHRSFARSFWSVDLCWLIRRAPLHHLTPKNSKQFSTSTRHLHIILVLGFARNLLPLMPLGAKCLLLLGSGNLGHLLLSKQSLSIFGHRSPRRCLKKGKVWKSKQKMMANKWIRERRHEYEPWTPQIEFSCCM